MLIHKTLPLAAIVVVATHLPEDIKSAIHKDYTGIALSVFLVYTALLVCFSVDFVRAKKKG